jgi:MoaA/NifB/PqqE/SkfB family radical SAM enzyme
MNYPFILFPITYKCNLHCGNCVVKNFNQELDIESSIKIIKNIPVEWVYITGGEPFLNDDLIDICKELKSNNKKIGVTTNGTIHNFDVLEYVDRIGVSIDGLKEYHDEYRGNGVFDLAIEFLNYCKNKESILMSTIYKESYNKVLDLKSIVYDLGVKYWQISRDVNDLSINLKKEDFNVDNIVTKVINNYMSHTLVLYGNNISLTKCNSNEVLSGIIYNPSFKSMGWIRIFFSQIFQDSNYDPDGILKTYLDIVNACCITGAKSRL